MAMSVALPAPKQPPLIEDLRNHTEEELAELRELVNAGPQGSLMSGLSAWRPDPRRPGFFEVRGPARVFYVFRYPSRNKIMLVGVWDRDLVAEMASRVCPAA